MNISYYVPPVMVIPPGGVPFAAVPSGAPLAPADPGRGVAGPLSPPQIGRPPEGPVPRSAQARKSDPRRSIQLVTIGDRLFRAGNTRRAAERYEQAVRAEPSSAVPRIRLSQIAMLRGQYAEAANHYREALLAEPDWLVKAPDIESIYGEPGDFARQITRLESHLQANPGDRDAWLVLGAQWFLSGRTREAGDIFLRLSDRKPDAALAAFLDATYTLNRAQ
jgi:tetratricopeptide (TPR) repeat protein